MASYFENKRKFDYERKKYYQEKGNVSLKYAAIVSISISIIILATAALCIESVSTKMLLVMRGCAGIFALIFVVLVAILVYRVNVSYFADKNRRK